MSRILNSAHKSISPLLLGVPVRPTILFIFGLTFRRLLNRLADADLKDDMTVNVIKALGCSIKNFIESEVH